MRTISLIFILIEEELFKLIDLIVFMRLDESVFHYTIEKLKCNAKQFSNNSNIEIYHQRDEYHGG